MLTSFGDSQILHWTRESKRIRFFDGADIQWYEIVVRPIDEPSREAKEGD
jgi:hypothetical protein